MVLFFGLFIERRRTEEAIHNHRDKIKSSNYCDDQEDFLFLFYFSDGNIFDSFK